MQPAFPVGAGREPSRTRRWSSSKALVAVLLEAHHHVADRAAAAVRAAAGVRQPVELDVEVRHAAGGVAAEADEAPDVVVHDGVVEVDVGDVVLVGRESRCRSPTWWGARTPCCPERAGVDVADRVGLAGGADVVPQPSPCRRRRRACCRRSRSPPRRPRSGRRRRRGLDREARDEQEEGEQSPQSSGAPGRSAACAPRVRRPCCAVLVFVRTRCMISPPVRVVPTEKFVR